DNFFLPGMIPEVSTDSERSTSPSDSEVSTDTSHRSAESTAEHVTDDILPILPSVNKPPPQGKSDSTPVRASVYLIAPNNGGELPAVVQRSMQTEPTASDQTEKRSYTRHRSRPPMLGDSLPVPRHRRGTATGGSIGEIGRAS